MEVENIAIALERTIFLLRQSESSDYAHFSAEELINQIELELMKIKYFNVVNREKLNYFFAPTGSLQDTAIDNGWGQEFLYLANVCT